MEEKQLISLEDLFKSKLNPCFIAIENIVKAQGGHVRDFETTEGQLASLQVCGLEKDNETNSYTRITDLIICLIDYEEETYVFEHDLVSDQQNEALEEEGWKYISLKMVNIKDYEGKFKHILERMGVSACKKLLIKKPPYSGSLGFKMVEAKIASFMSEALTSIKDLDNGYVQVDYTPEREALLIYKEVDYKVDEA